MDFRTERGYFSDDFKRAVVAEIESGKRIVSEVESTYGILGHSTILKWLRKYGEKGYGTMKKSCSDGIKIHGNDENALLRNQIKVLEKELKESRWKQATLETLIDIAEHHYSIVIKKNSGRKR